MDISKISDKELVEELKRREEEKAKQKKAELQKRYDFVTEHVDLLLELTPKHGRTSCSDENPCNGLYTPSRLPRCNRCALLQIKQEGYNDALVVDIDLRLA